jgi:hypothetical protein
LHHQSGSGSGLLQKSPFINGVRPAWKNDSGVVVDEELRMEYNSHKRIILEPHTEGDILSIYNYPIVNEISEEEILKQVTEIYNKEKHSFKLNFSFGMILQHVETQEYRFYYPHSNSDVLVVPFLFTQSDDLKQFHNMMYDQDFWGYVNKISGSTKWVVRMVCNVRYRISKTSFVLGQGDLPPYVNKSKAILSLHKNPHTMQTYDDGFCFFRCLTAFRLGSDRVAQFENGVQSLVVQWEKYKIEKNVKCDIGITMTQLLLLENFF